MYSLEKEAHISFWQEREGREHMPSSGSQNKTLLSLGHLASVDFALEIQEGSKSNQKCVERSGALYH